MRGAFAIFLGALTVVGCSERSAPSTPAPELAERAFEGVRFRIPPKDACHVDVGGYLMVVDAGDPTGVLPPSCHPAPFRYMVVDLKGEKPVVLSPMGPGAMDWSEVDCQQLKARFNFDTGFSLHESRLVEEQPSPALKCFATADRGVVAYQGVGADPKRRDLHFVYRGTVVKVFWTEPSAETDFARLTAVTAAVQSKLNEWSQASG